MRSATVLTAPPSTSPGEGAKRQKKILAEVLDAKRDLKSKTFDELTSEDRDRLLKVLALQAGLLKP